MIDDVRSMDNFNDKKRKKASVTKWRRKIQGEIDIINQKVGIVKGGKKGNIGNSWKVKVILNL